ncbi:hypothetical protein F8M41_002754 [Gigaspora margarita]|uniref:Peptidase S1 domain-containing protein n=1 Tax=Gigaspora margarita TaxID=4874 RepID=A0A8H3XD36_GIGMA|nr:hypothetical protein F8M41_002754 [Gigaspora margarita]
MTILKKNFIEISDNLKKYRPNFILCYIDMKLNNIVIRFHNWVKQNKDFLDSVRKYNPIFNRYRTPQHSICNQPEKIQTRIASRDINHKILNGDGIYNEVTYQRCSIGFPARNNDLFCFVTAGHCSNETKRRDIEIFLHFPWDSNQTYAELGRMVESEYIDEYDFGLIKIGENTTKLISTRIRNTDSDYAELNVDGGKILTSHGAHACKSGLMTHVTCGYVKGINTISANEVSGIYEDKVYFGKDDYEIGCAGDSGGTLFFLFTNFIKCEYKWHIQWRLRRSLFLLLILVNCLYSIK